MNAVVQKEVSPIDIQLYDCAKCFDSLWFTSECINDHYESGVKDDKLATIYHGNKKNNVLIKTPEGDTKRMKKNDIMTKGGSLAPSACT